MVIDPTSLLAEIDELAQGGHLDPALLGGEGGRLLVSDRAHAILPHHVLVDRLREQGSGAIGTTRRGVGPCYEDKVARRGVPMGAFRSAARTEQLVRNALESWAPTIAALGGKTPSVDEVMTGLGPLAKRIVPLLADTSERVDAALRAGKKLLFEGAQGTLLDVDHGTYPFVTSSNAVAGGACTGAGIGPTRIDAVVGLTKAYCTRVGGGPFPTELEDETGERLRKVGQEFGAVTGRPRRTGWLDLPALRYAVRVNGLDGLAITKLDVLTGLSEIRVCIGYRAPSGEPAGFPHDGTSGRTPTYESFPGWSESLEGARSLEDLPAAARRYVAFIEEQAGCPVWLVSVGSRREETILLRDPFGPS